MKKQENVIYNEKNQSILTDPEINLDDEISRQRL